MMFEFKDGALTYHGDPPRTMDDAWQITNAKWDLLSKIAEYDIEIKRTGARDTCGLCLFVNDWGCGGCPVREYTERMACEGTPYNSVCVALATKNKSKAEKAIKEEKDFLRMVEAWWRKRSQFGQ